jgi:hypothetical protein
LHTRETPGALRPKSSHSRNHKKVLNFIRIPKHIVVHPILQNSKQSEVTRTQIRRIWSVIHVYRAAMPHFIDGFLPIVAGRVVYVHGQTDQLFRLPKSRACLFK